MATNDDLDCVCIGHNDMDFSLVQEELKKMGKHSAAYMDLKAAQSGFAVNGSLTWIAWIC